MQSGKKSRSCLLSLDHRIYLRFKPDEFGVKEKFGE